MGKKKNRTRNVASFVRPGNGVRLHLPNSKSIRFNTAAMNNFIQTKFPYLVDRFGYNSGTTPFIFTTIRKKRGKLVKKKLINGKKTCK